jgi:hypothetical protein
MFIGELLEMLFGPTPEDKHRGHLSGYDIFTEKEAFIPQVLHCKQNIPPLLTTKI